MAEQSKTLSEPETDTVEYTEEEQASAEEAEKENEEEDQSLWEKFTSFIFEDSDDDAEEESNTSELDYENMSEEDKLLYDYMTADAETQKNYVYDDIRENVTNNYNMSDSDFLQAVESGWRTDENGDQKRFLGYKTIQNGEISTLDDDGNRLDAVEPEDGTIASDTCNCTLSSRYEDKANWIYNANGEKESYSNITPHRIVSYSGELGDFEYDATEWALAEKEITDDEGNTSTIQILKYVGTAFNGNEIQIPEGLNSLDYSFEGTNITTVPNLYNAIDEDGNAYSTINSAHCAFKDCECLTGFCTDYKEGEFFDYGGSATMPSELMDASGMFYGCTSLRESLSVAGDSCADARGIYCGDVSLKSKYNFIERFGAWVNDIAASVVNTAHTGASGLYYLAFGEELDDWSYDPEDKQTVTDAGNSMLNSIAQFASYEGTQVYNSGDDNIGGRVDEETGKVTDISGTQWEKEGYTEDDINNGVYQHEAEANANWSAENGVQDINDAYVLSAGSQFTFNYTDEDGNLVTTDSAREYLDNTEDQKGFGIMNILDFAGAVVTEYGISSFGLGFVTNSKLLKVAGSIGIVAVGQMANILPNSLSDMLSWVGDKVETISPEVGGIINDVANVLGSGKELDTTNNHQRDYLDEKLSTAEEQDESYKDKAKDSSEAPVSLTLKTQLFDQSCGLGILTERGEEYMGSKETIVSQMERNGEVLTEKGTIYSVTKAVTNGYLSMLDDQNEQAAYNAGEMATKYDTWASSNEDGKLTDTQKEAVFNEFDTLYAGFEAYANGALNKLQEQDNLSDEEMAKYENAIGQVMSSAMSPYIKMIKEMDETYDIMTDEQREQLNTYNIPGISSSTLQHNNEQEDIEEDDESVYKNAGINDDQDENVEPIEETKEDTTEEEPEIPEENNDVSNKGNIAEDAFEEVMDNYEKSKSENPEIEIIDSSLSA